MGGRASRKNKKVIKRHGGKVPEGHTASIVYHQCVVPGCENHIPQDNPKEAAPFCAKHQADLAFLLFVLPKVKMQRGQTKSGLIVPGHPQFSMEVAKGGPGEAQRSLGIFKP